MPRGGHTHVRSPPLACLRDGSRTLIFQWCHFFLCQIVFLSYFFCSITFSYCIDSIYCIVWLEYNACPVIKPIVVCRWQLWVFVVLCLFVCTFLCVCQYILCHLHYYLMLVCLDCTSCARNVYFVCIVCVHCGPLNPDHILMLP